MWRTLLVDDEEPIRTLLKTVLELSNFAVTTAPSAKAAIELLKQDRFDLVITDLRMESTLAGYEVVSFAKKLAPAPVAVILTAFPVPASEWRRVSADALFTKGGNTVHLGSQLQGLLNRRQDASRTARRR